VEINDVNGVLGDALSLVMYRAQHQACDFTKLSDNVKNRK
jgi:hypothetical protein